MRYRIADYGRVFSTRERGSRLLADFLAAYDVSSDRSIVLDFEDVLNMTPSFADEFVGELLVRNTRGQLPAPALENLQPAARRAVERCARVRGVALPRELVAA